MFRLHIDIPLSEDEQKSVDLSRSIAKVITEALETSRLTENDALKKFQYRLANDDDRSIRNYLLKDAEGHVRTKKIIVEL